MTDDPVDLAQVAADHAAIEQLRDARMAGDDPALGLLRDLLHDVESDLPQEAPIGHGSSQVIALANDTTPERRLVRNGTLVAVVTAGALSFGGIAAASTLAPEGSPLHGLAEVVRSAAGAVVGAVTPPRAPDSSSTDSRDSAGTAPTDLPSAAVDRRGISAPPSADAGAPGAAVSAAARSDAAARQVAALLDQAEARLADGRTDAAATRLDAAERRLAAVLPADAAALQTRLTLLRERVAAAERKATSTPRPASEKERSPESTRQDDDKSATAPRAKPSKREDGAKSRQPSKDASAKPRA